MPMPTSLLAACDQVPLSWTEPLYLPILFTLVGAGIWIGAKMTEIRDLKKLPWKWSAALPFLIALYSGFTTATCLTDSFYRSFIMQYAAKKYMTSHIGALAVPLLTVIGLGIWEWRSSRDAFRD